MCLLCAEVRHWARPFCLLDEGPKQDCCFAASLHAIPQGFSSSLALLSFLLSMAAAQMSPSTLLQPWPMPFQLQLVATVLHRPLLALSNQLHWGAC